MPDAEMIDTSTYNIVDTLSDTERLVCQQ